MGGKDLKLLMKSSKSIKRPVKRRYVPSIFKCKYCKKVFDRHLDLELHVASYHTCEICSFKGNKLSGHVCAHQHGSGLKAKRKHKTKFKQTLAFRGNIATFKHSCKPHYCSIQPFMVKFKEDVLEILKEFFRKRMQIKCQLTVWANFRREISEGQYEYSDKKALNSYLMVLLNVHGFEEFYSKCISKINNTVEIFEEFGSGWKLDKVQGFDFSVSTYKPFLSGCNTELPKWISTKRCVVNVRCTDNKCFQWGVLASLHPHPKSNQRNRPSSYKQYVKNYKFNCIKFPTSLKQIKDFEEANKKKRIAVNVFGFSNSNIFPVQISKFNLMKGYKKVNLLMSKCYNGHGDTADKNSYCSHFSTITSMDRLLGKSNHHKKQLCYSCLQRFSKNSDLRSHMLRCKQFDNQVVSIPKVDSNGKKPVHEFKHLYKKLKVSYVVYADFECLLQKRHVGKRKFQKIVTNSPKTSFTLKELRHRCSGYSWALVRSDGKLVQKKVYRGPSAVPIFLKEMSMLSEKVFELNKIVKPVIKTPAVMESLKNVSDCHICDKPLNNDVVLDHDHITGHVRSYAHSDCNLQFKQRNKLFIIFHNFKSYDSHLVVHGLRKFGNDIRVVPSGSSEKFMSIEVDNMVFLDSLQFLSSNLATLVENLVDSKHSFPLLQQAFRKKDIPLLTRKGVFCYDYIDKWSKFDDHPLPKRSAFYNFLTNTHVSQKDYYYAKRVYSRFKCQSIGAYHDLYLLSDTLLLAEVFENFRKMTLDYYKIDPVYYLSTPGVAWDAALLLTKVKLEQLVDIDQYIFFEAAMRGGVTMITKRFARAHNKYTDPKRDPKKSNYIIYLDKNNLYGEVMRWKLPTGGFKWRTNNISLDEILQTPSNSNKGYFVEADLTYPKYLHDKHKDLPLAPERRCIPRDWLSSYQKELISKLKLCYNEKQLKLVSHLGERKKYILHYENLKYYVKAGMKVETLHRVLEFNQSDWLKPFIDFNTIKRAEAKNTFEKDFFKLMNNATFGKSCQNMRRLVKIKLTNREDIALKHISSPLCQGIKILQSDLNNRPGLVLLKMKPKFIKLDKPIYVGCSVLDLSKLSMFRFHYQNIKKWYGERASLLMTDTDSLIYSIQTEDFFEDLKSHTQHFDLSEYDKKHFLYSEKNKKVIGKMKDELKGKIVTSFVGPGPKAYSLRTLDGGQKSAAKGVKQNIRKAYLLHGVYKKVISKQNKLFAYSRHIRSYKHKLYTIMSFKSAMHPFDSKRFILRNGISTLPYLHYRLSKNK